MPNFGMLMCTHKVMCTVYTECTVYISGPFFSSPVTCVFVRFLRPIENCIHFGCLLHRSDAVELGGGVEAEDLVVSLHARKKSHGRSSAVRNLIVHVVRLHWKEMTLNMKILDDFEIDSFHRISTISLPTLSVPMLSNSSQTILHSSPAFRSTV